jgi:hypothetical protein
MARTQLISNKTKARAAQKAAPYVAKGGAKAVKASGRHALRGVKAEARLARKALSSSEPKSTRYLKYGLFAVAGLAVGSLLGRVGGSQGGTSSSFSEGTGMHNPESGSPAGQRGQTWGSGSQVGTAGGASGAANYQAPGDANTIGADRDFSDPASGPLVGEEGHPEMDMTERNQIMEQRIRTGIGEQVDTKGLPKINVEVNDGVVDLRGPVPSEDVKQTIESVATNTDGVREVRNELTVTDV